MHRAALRVYRRLPVIARRLVVRTLAPSYTVGAICIVERGDGAVLLVRHSYRRRWGTPGGLLERGEEARDAARREVLEEVGIAVTLMGEPAVVVAPEPQRVDLVFRARPDVGDGAAAQPSSPEIVEVCWFAPDEIPELQPETADAFAALARARRARGVTPEWPGAGGGRAGSDGGAS
jgi:8-oxo-dGTP pyrophosphatase MutT (NUDIX family)